MSKRKVGQLTPAQKAVVERLRDGGSIRFEFMPDGSHQYTLMPDERTIRSDLAERMAGAGLIVGMDDALIPGIRPQTWVLAK